MKREHEIKLFDLFQTHKDQLELFESVKLLIEEVRLKQEEETDKYHGEILVKLLNSINNAGHEERRSKDISYIKDEWCKIIDKYPERY